MLVNKNRISSLVVFILHVVQRGFICYMCLYMYILQWDLRSFHSLFYIYYPFVIFHMLHVHIHVVVCLKNCWNSYVHQPESDGRPDIKMYLRSMMNDEALITWWINIKRTTIRSRVNRVQPDRSSCTVVLIGGAACNFMSIIVQLILSACFGHLTSKC